MDATLDAGLRLLDRQLVDKDGRLAGKVDDLEFDDPGDRSQPPRLTAILAGPGALAGRLGGPAGRWLAAISSRLRDAGQDSPARVPWGAVQDLDSAVQLRVGRDALATDAGEDWVRDHLIGRLPGAGDAAE